MPSSFPDVSFTHVFGRLNNLYGKENDELEFAFLNQAKAENHFKILIKPIQYKLSFEEKHIKQKVKLNDGSEAIYSKSFTGFDTITFDKNGFQYILSMDEDSSIKNAVNLLIEIANSVI